ncbi:hypothetical protein [Paraburkholderia sp. BL6669N2]|nr:hypothetical protein [Paraburkholderia sp. BL6669N2]
MARDTLQIGRYRLTPLGSAAYGAPTMFYNVALFPLNSRCSPAMEFGA